MTGAPPPPSQSPGSRQKQQEPPEPVQDTQRLRDELVRMAADDAAATADAHSDDFARQLDWRRLTTRHGDRLAEILDAHGWPTAGTVGEEAARAAWLVAQHADRQLDLQRRALRLMEQAVAEGRARADLLAYLHDRVRVNAGEKQRYGTQVAGMREDGSPVQWPCEDGPEQVDALRVAVGIPPFEEHVAQFAPPREAG